MRFVDVEANLKQKLSSNGPTWPIKVPLFALFLSNNMITYPTKLPVPCFYVGIENSMEMGVNKKK
jgi:hypothetical protein